MPNYNDYVGIADLYGLKNAFLPVPNSTPNADLINVVNRMATEFGGMLTTQVPSTYERDQAVRALREAVLWAHSAISLGTKTKNCKEL
jgi:hypothetical protein